MARVQLDISDPPNRWTLKAMLEADGHQVVDDAPDVMIADDVEAAVAHAQTCPALLLAAAGGIREAAAAMRRGVYGYVFVPLQPCEAGIMVERAAAPGGHVAPPPAVETAPLTLAQVEARHILETLRRCHNDQTETARQLGIARNTLWRKLKRIREEGHE